MSTPRTRGLPLAECRDCHDPIRFVHLNTGSVIPVNPAESITGNVAAVKVGGQLHGHVISRERPYQARMLRFTPHAATCEEIARPEPTPEPEPDPVLFEA